MQWLAAQVDVIRGTPGLNKNLLPANRFFLFPYFIIFPPPYFISHENQICMPAAAGIISTCFSWVIFY